MEFKKFTNDLKIIDVQKPDLGYKTSQTTTNSEFFQSKNLSRGTRYANYFCPDCKNITYSLRYMTKGVWHKVGLQWCNSCSTSKVTNNCIKGVRGLKINSKMEASTCI
jgi:hypothetical protein